MKKLIILTLAFALIMATAALASNTRVLTMGNNHVILTDDANIWNWSPRLNHHSDFLNEHTFSSYALSKFVISQSSYVVILLDRGTDSKLVN